MRCYICLFVLLCFWLTAFLPAIAQETEPASPLTLEECLKIAMSNQVDVLVSKNNLEAAKQRSAQAKAGYLPQISLENNAFTWGSEGVLNKRNTGTALTATQSIYDGGLRETRVAGARYGVTGSQAGMVRTIQSVTYNVTKAYYEVLRAKHLAEVADADVKYNQALKEMVESRVQVGDAAEVDVLPVEAQLANSRVNLLSAQNAVRVASVRLQNAMGLSPKSGFDVADVENMPNTEIKQLDYYVSAALKHRPDIIEAQAGVGSAKTSVKLSRIALYPRPVINAEYQRGFGDLERDSTQVFGGIVFDIFNGGSNRAAYREALANQDSAIQRNLQIEKDIQAQVEEAYLNLNNAKERLEASQIGLDAALRNYEVQQARYKQGLAITLDLLNAELQVVNARTNFVQARYDYYTALAQMDYAVGKDGGFNAD